MTRTVEVFRLTLVAKAEMDRVAAQEAEAEARGPGRGADGGRLRPRNGDAGDRRGGGADGTEAVTGNIADVSQGTEATGEAAVQVLGAAIDPSRRSDQLSAEIHRFLDGARAA